MTFVPSGILTPEARPDDGEVVAIDHQRDIVARWGTGAIDDPRAADDGGCLGARGSGEQGSGEEQGAEENHGTSFALVARYG
jgi:hypothetical protein